MNTYLVRVLVALVFAGLLWAQARASDDRPHRRRAFELAAAALLAFAALNASLAAGGQFSAIEFAVAAAGVALLVGAVVSLALALYNDEMRGQRDRITDAARKYRQRRAAGDQEPEKRDRP